MSAHRLHWWDDGTPATFKGVTITGGQANIGALVSMLVGCGVARIEVRLAPSAPGRDQS